MKIYFYQHDINYEKEVAEVEIIELEAKEKKDRYYLEDQKWRECNPIYKEELNQFSSFGACMFSLEKNKEIFELYKEGLIKYYEYLIEINKKELEKEDNVSFAKEASKYLIEKEYPKCIVLIIIPLLIILKYVKKCEYEEDKVNGM